VAAAEHLTHGSTEARPGEAVENEVGGVVGVVEKVCDGQIERDVTRLETRETSGPIFRSWSLSWSRGFCLDSGRIRFDQI